MVQLRILNLQNVPHPTRWVDTAAEWWLVHCAIDIHLFLQKTIKMHQFAEIHLITFKRRKDSKQQ